MGRDVVLVSSADETAFEVRRAARQSGAGTAARAGRGRASHRFAVVRRRRAGSASSAAGCSVPSSTRAEACRGRVSADGRAERHRPRLPGSYPGRAARAAATSCARRRTSVWLDAGPGTLANLQRHVALADLDAVVLSHRHPDHWLDLAGLPRRAALRPRARRACPVYGTAETCASRCRAIVGATSRPTFDWHVVDAGGDRHASATSTLALLAAPTTPSRRWPCASTTAGGRSPTPPTPARLVARRARRRALDLALVRGHARRTTEDGDGPAPAAPARPARWPARPACAASSSPTSPPGATPTPERAEAAAGVRRRRSSRRRTIDATHRASRSARTDTPTTRRPTDGPPTSCAPSPSSATSPRWPPGPCWSPSAARRCCAPRRSTTTSPAG